MKFQASWRDKLGLSFVDRFMMKISTDSFNVRLLMMRLYVWKRENVYINIKVNKNILILFLTDVREMIQLLLKIWKVVYTHSGDR